MGKQRGKESWVGEKMTREQRIDLVNLARAYLGAIVMTYLHMFVFAP